jgi:hypothetical protein
VTPPPRNARATLTQLVAVAVGISFLTVAGRARVADPAPVHADRTQTAVLHVLDEAVRSLGSPSAEYRRVLTAAIAELGADAGGAATAELRAFLDRAPEIGADFQCNAEFVRRRARKAVVRLREQLAGGPPRPIEPEVCYATPAALDFTRASTGETTVDIYGFDLDTVELQLALVNTDGFVDVTTALRRSSHYHLVADIRPGMVPLSAAARSLAVFWGHVIRFSVPIVQASTHLCPSVIETVPQGLSAAYARSLNARAFSGEATIDVSLEYSSNKLEAIICVVTDDTSISGCTTAFLYTTDSDSEIEAVLGPARGQIHLTGRERGAVKGPNSGPVQQWFRPGDPGRGPELDETSVAARFDQIQLVSTRDEACISPIVYGEGKRTTSFDPRVREALDRQLRPVDPRILALRPQFAPAR